MLVFFVFLEGQAWSQTSEVVYNAGAQANSVADLGYSARSAVLGPAFVAVADDASALFENPAGLAFLSRAEAAFHSYFGLVDAAQETAVLGLPLGAGGGIGLAGSYLDYGAFEGRDASGSLAPDYSPDRFGFQAGWGINLFDGLALGTALHYSRQDITGNSYSFFTGDVGALLGAWKGWKIGLDYLVPGWGSLGSPLVSVFRAGASCDIPLDSSLGVLVALGNSLQSNSLDYLQGGIEASYRSMYFLRVGYQVPFNDNGYDGFSNVSFGAGIILSDFGLDYAYSPSGSIADSNRFSLTYYFGQKPKNTVPISASSSTSSPSNPLLKGVSASSPGSSGITALSQSSTLSGSVSAPASTAVTIESPPSPGTPPKIEKGQDAGKSLTLHFDIPADYASQGNQMEAQGKHEEALGLYQQAVQQDPQNVQAWWAMGNIYYGLKQKTDMIRCFKKALELRPDNQALQQWLEKYEATP